MLLSFLTGRIGQVVEVYPLTIAIDPRGDDPEPIEVGSGQTMCLPQIQDGFLAIQGDGDLSPSAGSGGGVPEGPVVRFPVRQDHRTILPSCDPVQIPVEAIERIQKKPVATGALDGQAEKVVRSSRGLRVARLHAASRMKEPDQCGAVRNGAVKGDLAAGRDGLCE